MTKQEIKRKLLESLRKYVKHSEMVYKNSQMKSSQIKRDLCFKAVQLTADLNQYMELVTIAKRIRQIRDLLYDILPNPNNDSYQQSRQTLSEIITDCSVIISYHERPIQSEVTSGY